MQEVIIKFYMRMYCMANLSKPVIAAFDFDGTLTHRDSLLPFLHFANGTLATLKNIFLETPHLVLYTLGYLGRQTLKEAFLTRFLGGRNQQEIQSLAEQFAKQILPKMVRPKGLERIQWHNNQGHRCILISANLDIYLKPWSRMNGFHDTIASLVDFSDEGLVTGRLMGLNCRGPEKVHRLTELLGSRDKYILYAYGDSEGDRELLNIADYPFYKRLGP